MAASFGVGDFLQEDGPCRAASVLIGNVPHALDGVIHRVGVQGVVELAEFRVAGRDEDIEPVEGVHHVGRGQAVGLEPVAVEVGQDGAESSRRRRRARSPRATT